VKYLNKQVLFKLQNEVDDSQEELKEAIKQIFPIGSIVNVKRGNGMWKNIEVVCAYRGRDAGYFGGRTKNGKVHSFYWKDVDEIIE
jgi:hypothetical protein